MARKPKYLANQLGRLPDVCEEIKTVIRSVFRINRG